MKLGVIMALLRLINRCRFIHLPQAHLSALMQWAYPQLLKVFLWLTS
eukprot:CAMPEP_0185737080 /NCGR_PEP_ID=MMETSP1171-20130828/29625_1 /TAXON_ID=374046 /ORGANISM="Helicotheca tamensis, Strain CCMP826" /LENGTH=46 /DNA_ID= /DNA_START= /DNA_END= /DNA_ORIENTATION=